MLENLRHHEDWQDKNAIEKGFTLVELLVVVIILGILAAIVVFAVGNATDRAQTNACATEESTVEAALEAYRAETGAYPNAIGDLTGGANQFLREAPANHTIGAGDGTVTGVNACA